jgi:hypothetical protein
VPPFSLDFHYLILGHSEIESLEELKSATHSAILASSGRWTTIPLESCPLNVVVFNNSTVFVIQYLSESATSAFSTYEIGTNLRLRNRPTVTVPIALVRMNSPFSSG